MIKLQLKVYPDYSFTSIIDGIVYVFNVRWNDAFEFWALTITNVDGIRLAGDIMMTTNIDLFYEKRGLGLPRGRLTLVDTKENGTPPTYENILDYTLVYSE